MALEKIHGQLTALQAELEDAFKKLNIDSKKTELDDITAQSVQPDFWNDTGRAQKLTKRKAKLEDEITGWINLKESIDTSVLLAADTDTDESALQELYKTDEQTFAGLKKQLRFSGQFDSYDALVSIHAGAGGTDAQDWASMLYRMYVRWCESKDLKIELIDESRGEEAGLKSISFGVSAGTYVYGRLKAEHGVHRLVRLSPFNSDNLRQTSFAKVEVVPVIDTPDEVEIEDKDLKIDTYRSSGNGGQSVNTTDSAVRITHLPTNIVVAIQNEKSQLQNKETALKVLRSRLAQLQLEQHAERVSDLKGPNQSAEWGNQIRNYVLHPYKLVKDTRSGLEQSDPDKVLDGDIDAFIDAYLEHSIGEN